MHVLLSTKSWKGKIIYHLSDYFNKIAHDSSDFNITIFFDQVCRSCGEYIAPEEQRLSLPLKSSMVTSDPKVSSISPEKTMVHWHATSECFHCQVCRKSLLETKMTMKFGLVLCSSICAARAADAQYPSKPSNVLESDL